MPQRGLTGPANRQIQGSANLSSQEYVVAQAVVCFGASRVVMRPQPAPRVPRLAGPCDDRLRRTKDHRDPRRWSTLMFSAFPST